MGCTPRLGRTLALSLAVTLAGAACSGTVESANDAPPPSEESTEDVLTSSLPPADQGALDAAEQARLLEALDHQPDGLPPAFPIVRGVYSTKWSFWGERWERLLNLIETTELNAIVIDVKDDRGELSWAMDLELAAAPGAADWANTVPSIERAQERIQQLRDLGGYPIARIVCFKDSSVAQYRPDLAVIDTRTGQPWQGRDGQYWLNAYNDEAWQHCIDVGIQAAEAGFLEVQFDYVRFPNGGDGPSDYFSFPGVPPDRPQDEWRHPEEIREFLAEARVQLHSAGVRVSADVFGLTTYNYSWNGDGTGQVWEQLVEELDYISPMVYPSHYIGGNYGLWPHPQQHAYETILYSMEEAQLRSMGARAQVRPWLEDFGSPWLGSASIPHTPQRLRDQIQAAADKGIDSWMLWNAGNSYSVEALDAETVARAVEWTPDPDAPEGSGGDIRGEAGVQALIDLGPEVETPSERRAREAEEAAAREPEDAEDAGEGEQAPADADGGGA